MTNATEEQKVPRSNGIPGAMAIEIPFAGDEAFLRSLLSGKAKLITAALGENAWWYCPGSAYIPAPAKYIPPVVFNGGKVKFEWLLYDTDSEVVQAWSAFLCAAVTFASGARRVAARDKESGNETAAFHAFLIKLGMNTRENRAWRRILMKNLK